MAESKETLLRQWQMLRCIPREPQKKSTTQICSALAAEGHVMTARTVQRDLIKLTAIFGFTCDIEGRSQLWYWPRHAPNIDLPRLDTATALVFLLSEQYLQYQLPAATLAQLQPFFARAREVLAQDGKAQLARWPTKVRVVERGPRLIAPKIAADVQAGVFEAVLRDKCLRVNYKRRGASQGKSLLLNPLGLVVREGLIYLVATADEYTTPVQFALHRITSAEIEAQSSRPLAGFSLDRYLNEQGAFEYPRSAEMLKLVADFAATSVQHLMERKLSRDQEVVETDAHWSRLTATVRDTAELRWWLLGLSDQVVVRQPVRLRDEIKAALARAVSGYS